jgi:copper homeostasis protein CutC
MNLPIKQPKKPQVTVSVRADADLVDKMHSMNIDLKILFHMAMNDVVNMSKKSSRPRPKKS